MRTDLLKFSGPQEFFGNLQVLGAGIIEQALLGVEFRELQNAFERRLQLADLLVHRDALDGETLRGIGIANLLEAVGRFVDFPDARVEITHGVQHGQVLGVSLKDLFVLGNGVLELALLDVLLRSAQNFLFVKAETKCHKSADSSFFPAEDLLTKPGSLDRRAGTNCPGFSSPKGQHD